jgi:hypothetical protein
LLFGLVLFGGALLVSQGLTLTRFEYALGFVAAGAVFLLVFVRTEVGLYLALLSMLLSPEFAVGGRGALVEQREVVLRAEDLLLIVIALSWMAKTAVNKELGVVLKTPLNRPIAAYIATHFLATLVGYLTGTVKSAAGFFYVLKYAEYFVIYYMVVNNVQDRFQARRLIRVAFFAAVVVSLIGIAQIPSGQRVSAPFEGEAGEPNTFGGYLLLMMALAAGVALEAGALRVRLLSAGLAALMFVPFLYTQSRASYLAVLPAYLTLVALTRRRRLAVGLLLVGLVGGVVFTPAPVSKRILDTFREQPYQPTVRIGGVPFDPSTSERLLAMKSAFEGWTKRPFLGYGVTGFHFMDTQYFRTLVETGGVGFLALLYLLWMVWKSAFQTYRREEDPSFRGLAAGFLAGFVGLLVHAIGSNTFIIIRIMEPFWFFVGLFVVWPYLAAPPAQPGAAGPRV